MTKSKNYGLHNRIAGDVVYLVLKYTPTLLFLIVLVTFGIFANHFFEVQNFSNIFKQASFIGIVAIGMTFVMLTAGIDLSVGTNMYLSAVTAGVLMQNFGLSPTVAFFGCLATGLLVGACNAVLIVRFKLAPFIATLGILVAGRGVGLLITQSKGITLPFEILEFGGGNLWGIPYPVVVFAVVVLISHIVLSRTPLGRHIYAVGNDAEVAERASINVGATLTAVYLISGCCAALGGFVSVSQLGVVNPGFGEFNELDAIAIAVLGGASLFGGVGNVLPGTVLGALLIQMVQSGLVSLGVDIYIQPLIQAFIIFLAVFLDSIRNERLAKLGRRNIRVEPE